MGGYILELIRVDFNPRTHRGVRRHKRCKCTIEVKFQSTHPSWGATSAYMYPQKALCNFNPRTHRGVRQNQCILMKKCDKFQSTHPSWGATLFVMVKHGVTLISIHAPIVGCDGQPTQGKKALSNISIHAPIVGCDRRHKKH